MKTLEQLEREIQDLLAKLVPIGLCIALSGGVDRALLLKFACEAGGQVHAVTFSTVLQSVSGLAAAEQTARSYNCRHTVITIHELSDRRILQNTPERCYYCKRLLFGRLRAYAREHGLRTVAEGSNADDLLQYKPGLRALRELSVVSPLASLGVTKEQVRALARQKKIPVAERPSTPCLATRIPYYTPICLESIARIDQAEDFLRSVGFEEVRVREHRDTARIEVPADRLGDLLARSGAVTRCLQSLGYVYVTLDLEGLRSGSMDEGLRGRGGLRMPGRKENGADQWKNW